jgi:hypothetical protein
MSVAAKIVEMRFVYDMSGFDQSSKLMNLPVPQSAAKASATTSAIRHVARRSGQHTYAFDHTVMTKMMNGPTGWKANVLESVEKHYSRASFNKTNSSNMILPALALASGVKCV